MKSLSAYTESQEDEAELTTDLEIPPARLVALNPPLLPDPDPHNPDWPVLRIPHTYASQNKEEGEECDSAMRLDVDDPLALAAAQLGAEWDPDSAVDAEDAKTWSLDSARTARGMSPSIVPITAGAFDAASATCKPDFERDAVPSFRDSNLDQPQVALAPPGRQRRFSIASLGESDNGPLAGLEDDFELPVNVKVATANAGENSQPALALRISLAPAPLQQDHSVLPADLSAEERGGGPTSSATEEDDDDDDAADFFRDLILPSYFLTPTASATTSASLGDETPCTPPTSEGEGEPESVNAPQTSYGAPTRRVGVDLQSILREKLEQRGGRGLSFAGGPPATPHERERLERHREGPEELVEAAAQLDLDLDCERPFSAPAPASATVGASATTTKSGHPTTGADDAGPARPRRRLQTWTADQMRDRLRTVSGARARARHVPVAQPVPAASRPLGASCAPTGGLALASNPASSRPLPRSDLRGPVGPPSEPRQAGPATRPVEQATTSASYHSLAKGPRARTASLRTSVSVSNLPRAGKSATKGSLSIPSTSPGLAVPSKSPSLRPRQSQQHLSSSSSLLSAIGTQTHSRSTLERRRSWQSITPVAARPAPGATSRPPSGQGLLASPSPMRSHLPSYAAPTAASANRARERTRSSAAVPPSPIPPPDVPFSSRIRPLPLPSASAQGSVRSRHLQVMPAPASRAPSRSNSPVKPSLASTPRLPSSLTTTSMRTRAVPTHYTLPQPFTTPARSRPNQYGNGTELDAFDDLPVSKQREKEWTVQPASRKSSGASSATSKPASWGRKAGVKAASSLRTSGDLPSSKPQHGGEKDKSKPGEVDRKKVSRRREPHLIRHLGGNAAISAQSDMTYNPVLQRWEGNEAVLRDFDKASATSARPALISPLSSTVLSPTKSGLTSAQQSAHTGQTNSAKLFVLGANASTSRAAAKVVGDMVFNPTTCSWHSLAGPEGENELDLDWAGGASGGENADDEAFFGGGGTTSELDGWELGERERMRQGRASLLLDEDSDSDDDAGALAREPDRRRKSTKRQLWRESQAAEERCRQEMRDWITRRREEGAPVAQRRWLWDLRSLILDS
ncbi:hypothetical protein JCM3774_001965 [Rhodotorula dairenensis]